MLLIPSVLWVLIMISKITNVGPGAWLFNNQYFWLLFGAVFIGPMLLNKRLKAGMSHAHNDRIIKVFRFGVELPVTIWFFVRFPGYWYYCLAIPIALLLLWANPRLERWTAEQKAREAEQKAARDHNQPNSK